MKAIDLRGRRFGRLLVEGLSAPKIMAGTPRRAWLCRCDCGSSLVVLGRSLSSGNTRSCGCFKHDQLTTHGKTKTVEYRAWAGMVQRCSNPSHARYKDWGGRGISVCQRWQTFDNFLADMGKRPSRDHSLDRHPDNDGIYEPGNCRWATRSQQQQNKRAPADPTAMMAGRIRWAQSNPEAASRISRQNIRRAHRAGDLNPNAKMSSATAELLRATKEQNPDLTLTELGGMFGVGRETARKVIRGLAWQ